MEQICGNLQGILEMGLVKGLWSVAQFNKKADKPTHPSVAFVLEHPEFRDHNFRDLDTYKAAGRIEPFL